MNPIKITICLLAAFIMSSSVAAHAFWGIGDDKASGLNLETGYDANTVTTVTGRIVSLNSGDEHGNARLELVSGDLRIVVVLGPQGYWAEHGIALKPGDSVTVRGSKAQGGDGVVYLLAQKITETSLNTSVTLRNESGQSEWSGGGAGRSASRNAGRPATMRSQSPGRMGSGRMGR
ncbi:MAG: hypothetical protein PHP95_09865 [Desulfuromonadaceae bacterium]|nr:hypothetical protein [Desulfuromonadaceae bacterium]MDD2848749.1 hypothetical protein [Desulfuromonadaceae bacterium]MDD4130399.1 hypothetical protein [Desulfuromonadaceae bacterium]